MKIVSHDQPFYLLEVAFLISKTINYRKDGPRSLEHSSDKVNKITFLYPNFLSDYEKLLIDTSSFLDKYPKIVKIHKLLPLGTFTSMMYHLPFFDFSEISLQDFSKAALIVLFSTLNDEDLDRAKDLYQLSKDILKDGTINFSLLLKEFKKFDLEADTKYEILNYFNDIESIFEEYKKLHYEILDSYITFYQLHKDTITDNQVPTSMKDLNLERWIDFDSFKEYSSNFFHFSFSLVNYNGLSAKLAIVDDELTFGMQGVFLSVFQDLEKENIVSISDVELQMSALGDSKRIQIFALLFKEEHYLKELADALELSSSTLSHHMDILQSAGLVKMRAKGKRVYYSLNPQEIQFIANFFQKVAGSLEIPS